MWWHWHPAASHGPCYYPLNEEGSLVETNEHIHVLSCNSNYYLSLHAAIYGTKRPSTKVRKMTVFMFKFDLWKTSSSVIYTPEWFYFSRCSLFLYLWLCSTSTLLGFTAYLRAEPRNVLPHSFWRVASRLAGTKRSWQLTFELCWARQTLILGTKVTSVSSIFLADI